MQLLYFVAMSHAFPNIKNDLLKEDVKRESATSRDTIQMQCTPLYVNIATLSRFTLDEQGWLCIHPEVRSVSIRASVTTRKKDGRPDTGPRVFKELSSLSVNARRGKEVGRYI